MYQIMCRCNEDVKGSPFVTVKEHWDASICFWFRSEKPIGHLMGKAISLVFDNGFRKSWNDIDAIVKSVFCQWKNVVTEHHEQSCLPPCEDIRREYPFQMHVVVIPPTYSNLDIRIKKFNECGEIKAPAADEDLVEVSWKATTGVFSQDPVRFDTRFPGFRLDYGALIQPGILCFREKEPAGIPESANRDINDWKSYLASVAVKAVCAGEGISACDFDGSFLLVVNKAKIASYQNREWETAPVIHVKKGFNTVFAFCAKPGVMKYDDMDVLQGTGFSSDEYLEITEVADAYIKFTVKIRHSDIKNDEFTLQKGQTQTFAYKSEKESSYSDGCDFLEEVATSITLSWE